MLRRALAVVLSVTLIGGGGIVARAVALDEDRARLLSEVARLDAEIAAQRTRADAIEVEIAGQQQIQAEGNAVLAVRPAFVEELGRLAGALQEADGKVDVSAHRAAAVAAQEEVIGERRDPDAVRRATAQVHALVGKVTGEVEAWQRAQTRVPVVASVPGTANAGSGGYARVRAALDRVGGAGVGLYESASCAGGSAPACANSDGYIKYRADVASWDDGRLNWAMAHELAHIYQFRVWGALNASGAYASLFGGDPEFLANCMAAVRGYAGSVGCTGDQQAWASQIWVGAVG